MIVNQNIKMLRMRANMTCEVAAQELSIATTTYRNIEYGLCEPKASTLLKVKKLYGVDLNKLLMEQI